MGLSLQTLYGVVRRWWLLLLVMPLACGALLLYVGMSRTPMYASTTTMLVTVSPSGSLDDYTANLLAQELTETYQTLVGTDPVLSAAGASVTPPVSVDHLRGSTSVAASSGALFMITVVDSDPVRAAALVNALSVELTEFVDSLSDSAGGEEGTTLTTVVQGTVPENPYAPRLPAYLAFGIIAGFALAAVAIALHERLNTRVRSADDVVALAGLDSLARIPVIRKHLAGADSILLDDPDAQEAAESLRVMRTAVLAAVNQDDRHVLVVSSPGTGDGKSLIAVNLAETLSRAGKLVLLIDANFRAPRLHEVYDLDNTRGLGALLPDGPQAWKTVAVRVATNLAVIPAGQTRCQSSDLLMSADFGALIDDVLALADVVIVDTPALDVASDAIAAATHAGKVLLVCRTGSTRAPDLARARELFEAAGASVIGVVVNGGAGSGPRRTFRQVAQQIRHPGKTAATTVEPFLASGISASD